METVKLNEISFVEALFCSGLNFLKNTMAQKRNISNKKGAMSWIKGVDKMLGTG
jgi:hypothetical protein